MSLGTQAAVQRTHSLSRGHTSCPEVTLAPIASGACVSGFGRNMANIEKHVLEIEKDTISYSANSEDCNLRNYVY